MIFGRSVEAADLIEALRRAQEAARALIDASGSDDLRAHAAHVAGEIAGALEIAAQDARADRAARSETVRAPEDAPDDARDTPAERLLSAQYATTRILSEAESVEAAMPLVLESICTTLGWRCGLFWRPTASGDVLRCEATWCAPDAPAPEFVSLSRGIAFTSGTGLPGRVWAAGSAAWISNVVEDPNFPRFVVAEKEGLRAGFAFPLRFAGEFLGLLEFFSEEIRSSDQTVLDLMEGVGGQIGQFIKRTDATTALRINEARLSALIRSATDAIITVDAEQRIRVFNMAAEALFGRPVGEVIGQPIDTYLPGAIAGARDVAEQHPARYDEQRAAARPRGRLKGVRADGSVFPADAALSSFESGGQVFWTLIVRDITEDRRIEEARAQLLDVLHQERRRVEELATELADERRFLASIVDSVPVGIAYLDRDLYYRLCNTTNAAYLGRPIENVIGHHLEEVLPDNKTAWETVRHVIDTGEPYYNRTSSVAFADRPDETREFILAFVPDRDIEGAVRGVFVMVQEVTDLVQARAAQRESEERYRRIVETAEEGIWMLDAEGRTTFANAKIAEMLGLTPVAMLGRHLFDFLDKDDRTTALKNLKRRRGAREQHDFKFVRANGEVFWALVSTSPVFDHAGHYAGALAMVMDITERKRVEQELRESHQRTIDILEGITDAFAALDVESRFTYVNAAAEKLLGLPRGEVLGRSQWEVFPAAVGTPFERATRRVIDERVAEHFEMYYGPWNAWVEIHTYPSRDGGLSVYFRDITDRKLAEQERARLLADEQAARTEAEVTRARAEAAAARTLALQEVTSALSEAATPAKVAEVVVELGLATVGAAAGMVALLVEGETALEPLHAVGDFFPLSESVRIPMTAALPSVDAARSREALWIESPEQLTALYPHLTAVAAELRHRAWAGIPLVFEDRVLGVIVLSFADERHFSAEDRSYILALARQCAQALDRARLFEAERASRARLAILAEASRVFAEASLDFEALLQAITRYVAEKVGEACAIRLLSDDGRWLDPVAVHHPDPEVLSDLRDLMAVAPLRADEGVWGQVMSHGQVTVVPHISPEVARAAAPEEIQPFLRRFALCGLVVAPLRSQNRVVGTLAIGRTDPSHVFTKDDEILLRDLADRAALALETARSYEAEQWARQNAEGAATRVARLQEIAVALAEALTSEQVAYSALRLSLPGTNAHAGVVALVSANGQTLEVVAEEGYAEGFVDTRRRFPIGAHLPLAAAFRTGEPLWIHSPMDHESVYPDLESTLPGMAGTQALACLPLIAHARVAGVLGLAFPTPQRFASNDRAFLLTLARQCAQALDRARLYEAQRTSNERLLFLSEVSAALAASLDERTTMESLTQLAVPRFADGCWVDLVDETAGVTLAAGHHVEPHVLARWRERRQILASSKGEDPWLALINEGRSRLLEDISEELLSTSSYNKEHLQLLKEFGNTTYLYVPLIVQGHPIGGISFVRTGIRRPYEGADLALAEVLGRRASMAIENARLYTESQKAVRLRDDFLSIAGHELRTPLTALQLYLHTLLSGASERSPLEKRLRSAGRQVERLSRLINELLDVSRLTAGRLELEIGEVDLTALTREIVERFGDELARTGSSMVFSADGPVVGHWDHMRLDQIITNLVSNAIKYGRGKPIDVSVAAVDGQARLVVCDRGIGIEPEHQARIFRRFERAVSDHNYGGFGLGLWIASEIVNAHGGTISVRSEPGEGSCFTVDLPLDFDAKVTEP
jgi:PAS domain S-box-containing protein